MTRVLYRPVRLPMYDWPELRQETGALEAALTDAICAALKIAPSTLLPWADNSPLSRIWTDPGLLLAQTCGYPLTHALSGEAALVGTPHYDAEGCSGVYYCSHFIVARHSTLWDLSDLRRTSAVFNSIDSQSGMNALRSAVAEHANGKPFFKRVIESRGHLASMETIASGAADVAAIDAICWHLARQERPELAQHLKSIGVSEQVPGLPFITSLIHGSETRAVIADAVEGVMTSPETQKSRQRLRISGFSKLELSEYAPILSMENRARDLGYPVLG